MIILAVESSCDETAVSVVENGADICGQIALRLRLRCTGSTVV